MNVIAMGQSVLGLVMQFGKGMVPSKDQKKAAFLISGIPVYHIGYNPFKIEYDCIRKNLIKWGEFTHPFMMVGMPDVSGRVKVYVDSSVPDMYILVVRAQLDPAMQGPSYPAWNIACWTPRRPGDSRHKAATRMFHALVLHMDGLELETDTYAYADDNPDWATDWEPSKYCLEAFKKVRL